VILKGQYRFCKDLPHPRPVGCPNATGWNAFKQIAGWNIRYADDDDGDNNMYLSMYERLDRSYYYHHFYHYYHLVHHLLHHHHFRFLHDFSHLKQFSRINPNIYGLVETLICSRATKFIGTFFSTYSGKWWW